MKTLEHKYVGSPGGGWEVHTRVSDVDEAPEGAFLVSEVAEDHDWQAASHDELAVINGKEAI